MYICIYHLTALLIFEYLDTKNYIREGQNLVQLLIIRYSSTETNFTQLLAKISIVLRII